MILEWNWISFQFYIEGTEREKIRSLRKNIQVCDARVYALNLHTQKKAQRDDVFHAASLSLPQTSYQEHQFWFWKWYLFILNLRWWIWRLTHFRTWLLLERWSFITTNIHVLINKASQPLIRAHCVRDTVLHMRHTKMNKTCYLPLKGPQASGWNKCWATLFP